MSGTQLKILREQVLELSQEEFGKRIGVSRRTILRAEARESKRISHILEMLIERAVLKGDLRIQGD